MFPAIRYLDFAARFFGRVEHDLATSGLEPVSAEELGWAPPDDPDSRQGFCAAVAHRYGVPEDEVAPTPGASGALFYGHAALLRGGRALVEAPGYEPLWRVVEGLGAGVDFFERAPAAGYAVEVDSVLRSMTPDTRVVAITNPHNPTGVLTGEAVLGELAAELAKHDAVLFVDEVYLEGARAAGTARHLGSNVVTCSSTTKCWGVPWPRAGWILAPPEIVHRIGIVERHAAGYGAPAAWAWGRLALENAARLAERAVRIQKGKREVVEEFVEEHAARLDWSAPHAGSLYGWVRDRGGSDLTRRVEGGIHAHGVLVAPGEYFGAPSAFRLSWTADIDRLRRGLARLEQVLGLP